MALVEALCQEFKLIKASVPTDIMNILSGHPHLLSATFDINGRACQVMIDTGATISCLPEHGDIMTHTRNKPQRANLVIELANGKVEHVNKRIRVYIRPSGSRTLAAPAEFYIQNGARSIFGYQALIGLNHLKLFDLQISTVNGHVTIHHQGNLIGQETQALNQTKAGLKVLDRVVPSPEDDDVQRLINKYKEVFTDLDDCPIRGEPMRFFTVHQRPIAVKQRLWDNREEIHEIKKHVDNLLSKGIIEPSRSGYAANCRTVPKKNGKRRLVINYIPLNAITHRDAYATPRVSDMLSVIEGNKYFSTMDCSQSYYQIEVDQRDRHKTAFYTPFGNFQFRRCPFGAKNSGARYQAEMNRIFYEGLYTRCIIYVDDILVFGRTKQEHNDNLAWVLKLCQEFHVKLNREKCFFARTEVDYLGYTITGHSIKAQREKVDELLGFKSPRDKTELRSLMGSLNFYSRFIPGFSKQYEPLRELLNKNKDFQWKDYHQKAFEGLITRLNVIETQLLVSKNVNKVITLHILADSIEVLLLTHDDRLVMRASRLLSSAEANYSNIEKQMLALVFAVNKFRVLINPCHTKVKVPNKDLEKVIKMVNRPERIDNLLLKMPAGFDEFTFEVDKSLVLADSKRKASHIAEEIFYVDGACRSNGKPNCRASWAVCAEYNKDLELKGEVIDNPSSQTGELTAGIRACEIAKSLKLKTITIVTDSRYIFHAATSWIDSWSSKGWTDNKKKRLVNVELFKQLLDAKRDLDIEWMHVDRDSGNPGNVRADTLAKSVLDPKAAILYAMSTDVDKLQHDNDEIIELKEKIRSKQANNLTMIDDVIYYLDTKMPEGSQYRVYVPTISRHHLLTLAHDDNKFGGHLGIKKTYRKLTRFWWPRMHHDVECYVKSCTSCQRFKDPKGMPPGYLHNIPVSQLFENVHIDIVGPLTTTYRGNKHVITATDAFSKWAYAKAYQNVTTADVIEFVEDNILSVHGNPQRMISDKGGQFMSEEFQKFLGKLNIKHSNTSGWHPQSNGIDERVNGTLARILRNYSDEFQERWDRELKWAVYLYNNTVHDSTGYSPYQIVHKVDPSSPLKPLTPRDESSSSVLTQSAESILETARLNIKRAQADQKKYYDRHRSQHKFYVGQLVYHKINVVPRHLSKKLYFRWDGPCVIISFVGDHSNPKAVQILDWENMKKKVVAINSIKPLIDIYRRPDEPKPQNQKGGGHTPVVSDSLDYRDPSYYHISTHEDDSTLRASDELLSQSCGENLLPSQGDALPNSNSERVEETHNDNLDITQKTLTGPLTSSPRRVTISDSVTCFNYDPIDPTLDNHEQATLAQESLSRNPPPEQYNVDDPRRDPTYEPSDTQPTVIAESSTGDQAASQPRLSSGSQPPRYNFRVNPKKRVLFKYPSYARPSKRRARNNASTVSDRTLLPSQVQDSSNQESDTNSPHMQSSQDSPSDKVALLIDISDDTEDLMRF